ncbi:hypothetical protein DL770_004338 [Monosporascus sp. CRB-9-2]|nr:hypothetical protein DL770_004338 [Monosporascus sp. CRB-9-2]
MGKLYAIADLHLSYKLNADALDALHDVHGDDGLILAGDLGEREEHLETAFRWARAHFKTVWWCPGNHELYTLPSGKTTSPDDDDDYGEGGGKEPRGQAKYDACVAVARRHGVLTPEDPFVVWDCSDEEDGGGGGGDGRAAKALVCPIFTLYDYSFAPDGVPRGKEVEWAAEEGVCATDEVLLHPDPYPSREAWCDALLKRTEARLAEAAAEASAQGMKLVIANHWPLHERVVALPAVPRFRIWCGSRRTGDWHTRFGAAVVVSGHIHIRRTDWIDGVRFEECSLGYPRQWQRARDAGRDINAFLREILPGPAERGEEGVTRWRTLGGP